MHHPHFSQPHVPFQQQGQSAPMEAGSIGRRIGEHKGRLELRDVMPIGGVLLILLGIAGGAATIPDILAGTESVTSLGFVPICVALGALLLWRTVRQMKQTLDVCEGGFIHRIGNTVQIVPWSEVVGQRAVRIVGPNGLEKGFRLVLALSDGSKLTFTTWLQNVHGLHAHVSSFIAPF